MSRKAQHKNKTGLKGVPRFGSKALNYWSVWKVEINPITPDEKGNETESGKTLIYVTFHSEKKIAEMEVKDCIKKYGGAHCRAFEYDRIDWTLDHTRRLFFVVFCYTNFF